MQFIFLLGYHFYAALHRQCKNIPQKAETHCGFFCRGSDSVSPDLTLRCRHKDSSDQINTDLLSFLLLSHPTSTIVTHCRFLSFSFTSTHNAQIPLATLHHCKCLACKLDFIRSFWRSHGYTCPHAAAAALAPKVPSSHSLWCWSNAAICTARHGPASATGRKQQP